LYFAIQGNRVQNLNSIIQEYTDSFALIVKCSEIVELDPITSVPVLVLSLQRLNSLSLLRNQYNIVSVFLLFPESTSFSLDLELKPLFREDTVIYLNIFMNSKYNTRP